MLIDTHCHLDFPAFDPDRDQVIRRALDTEIKYFINIGATLESSAAAVALAGKYPEVYASVGVHPHDADTFDLAAEGLLRQLAAGKKVVAIGETGLDYYRNLSSRENQKRVFCKQIDLAKELDLPLVIHSREAFEETLQILKPALPLRAVVHCFSGDENFLKACLDYGFFISYTCNITYKKAAFLREMVNLTPLDRLMLETDAPYLSPEGSRGQRNEPAQIELLARQVSQIKGVSFEKIADQTTCNAKGFFNLK
ncbi:MAG TPA: TatD family hydrolase [Candidatus Omnitrophota bacterium]|nr:TatD family hydrolase [Candidatus Omnitrophota bacterium]HPT39513.1 TatD family hydrolase [Candidatus Omnitrophota bacterium]